MKTSHIAVFVSVASFVISCQKPYPDPVSPEVILPPVSTDGKNTFGCRINDTGWIAFIGGSTVNATNIYRDNQKISIRAEQISNAPPLNSTIWITFWYNGDSTYLLSRENGDAYAYFSDRTGKQWKTSTNVNGVIRLLRFDPAERIISGTFFFNCEDAHKSSIKHITEGRFDQKY